ncbi:GAP family protein [Geodermatophilus nigrescens]|uniref:Sap, sulfolipid-1-addressing protein n=1 Tax=Geodermatophilus nigrescens TaxID=1070870 RepID=A0A1M5DN98_9ACTN|nr:GAP family protein [Geodermatophilus nigrescens]SHF68376.1 Sap, sulfolipid-1-addressing protein [Geodermatophilus nigrescens]
MGELLWSLAGLALLDSLNPATIVGVAVILLSPAARPAPLALAYVAGAFATVLAVGAALYLGAGALAGALDGGTVWIRRGALGLAAVLLLVAAVRRLRTRPRRPVRLPRWFGIWTAAPAGVLVTAADLPNAFPYLVAIERMLASAVPPGPALLLLAGYALVYCLPCLVLLAAGLAHGDRVRRRLRALRSRAAGDGTVAASVPRAALLFASAVAVGGLAAYA